MSSISDSVVNVSAKVDPSDDTSSTNSSVTDTWTEALASLKEKHRNRLTTLGQNHTTVLEDVLSAVNKRKTECLKKQWKVSVRGKTIILRDIFEKLAVWVNKFIVVGDTAVQYDPGHAALPWAVIRFILNAGISDVEAFGMVAQDTELLANVITRCAILENLYLRDSMQIGKQLRGIVVATNASVLKYLSTVLEYFEDNTAIRFVKATFHAQGKLEKEYKAINDNQDALMLIAGIAEAERISAVSEDVGQLKHKLDQNTVEDTDREQRLVELFHGLDEPMRRIDIKLDELRDQLKDEQRAKILRSISTIPYPMHHKTAARDRLRDSGQWLLQKEAYKRWRASSASSVLWLHGIPGSGKTKLTSLIIDEVKTQDHLAFFYCVRNSAEPFRAETDKILACLVRQLASTAGNKSILEPVVAQYEEALQGFMDFEDQAWSAEESHENLLQLLPLYPSVTIVIDALDEVNQSDRSGLIDALNDLVASSATLVKVFISSRENYDIVLRLQDLPNVYIHMDENSQDVERFIKERLTRAKLLNGAMSSDLQSKVMDTLQDRAQGMFRMVDLQIQTLKLLKTSADIESRLTKLPVTLHESYKEIYDDIKNAGDHAFALAKMTFQWLLVAKEQISLQDFALLTPFWPSSTGHAYSVSEINDTCAVLISVDEWSFKFSHLSVREFFDNIAAGEDIDFRSSHANAALASACLSYLTHVLDHYRLAESGKSNTSQSSNEKDSVADEPTDSDEARRDPLQHHTAHTGNDVVDMEKTRAELLESFKDIPGSSKKLNLYTSSNWGVHAGQCDDLSSETPLYRLLHDFIIGEDGLTWKWLACSRIASSETSRAEGRNHSHFKNPIWFACDHNALDLLQDLLAISYQGKLSDSRDREGTFQLSPFKSETPLWYAISEGKVDVFRAILGHHPKGLMSLLTPEAVQIVEAHMMRYDSIPDISDTAGRKPSITRSDLYKEASSRAAEIFDGDPEAISVFVRCLAQDRDLLEAVEKGDHPIVIHSLLVHGIGRQYLSRALINAFAYGHIDTARVLIEHGAEKEKVAVVRALKRGLYNTAARLIEAGYDLTGRYLERRRTALHYAAASGRMDIVQLLLNRGSNVRKFDGDGCQPHHLAAKSKHWDIVSVLQDHGADLDTLDKYGWKVSDVMPQREGRASENDTTASVTELRSIGEHSG